MLTERERPKVVVLVEKDRAVREVMMQCLAEEHYTVFAEEDPKAALWYFKHYTGPIDLLIADVATPKKNAVTFVHTVNHTSSQTRILLTGDVEDEPGFGKEVNRLALFFLAKPFTPAQLLIFMTVIFEQPVPSSAEDEDSELA